jgi:hypothetical protein
MRCWIPILFGKTKVNDVNLQNNQFSVPVASMASEHLIAALTCYSYTNSSYAWVEICTILS